MYIPRPGDEHGSYEYLTDEQEDATFTEDKEDAASTENKEGEVLRRGRRHRIL